MAFSSDPTANRISIRMIIFAATMFRLRIGNADVTQAFLQSDTVAFEDRQVVCLPGYVIVPGRNHVVEKVRRRNLVESDFRVMDWDEWGNTKKKEKSNFSRALLTRKPHYGGRDAPLRWFITASRIIRMKGWRQMRSD